MLNDQWLSGYDSWKTTEPPESEPDPRLEDEAVREQRWASFMADCRDFAHSERDGFAAVLRAVAEAMKDQRELPPRA